MIVQRVREIGVAGDVYVCQDDDGDEVNVESYHIEEMIVKVRKRQIYVDVALDSGKRERERDAKVALRYSLYEECLCRVGGLPPSVM